MKLARIRMRTQVTVMAFAIAALGDARPANAQFAFAADLLKRVTDVSFFTTFKDGPITWDAPTPGTGGKVSPGIGIELLFEISTWYGTAPTCGKARADSAKAKATRPIAGCSAGRADTLRVAVTADTAYTPTTAEVKRVGALVADSTTTYTVKITKSEPRREIMLFELGVSYLENPFMVSSPNADIRGALRELPAVALYGNIRVDLFSYIPLLKKLPDAGLSPYIGAKVGQVSLAGLRAYMPAAVDTTTGMPVDKVKVVKGSADAFRLGGLIGLVGSIGPFNAFVNAERNHRRLPALQWEGDVPTSLPRELKFHKWTYSAGVQVSLAKLAGS